MANLQIDTKKIRENGEDILILIKELNEEFDMLFNRISNINTRTYEWIGSSSAEYIRRANIERTQYKKFTNSLSKYASALISIADNFDWLISKKRWKYG